MSQGTDCLEEQVEMDQAWDAYAAAAAVADEKRTEWQDAEAIAQQLLQEWETKRTAWLACVNGGGQGSQAP